MSEIADSNSLLPSSGEILSTRIENDASDQQMDFELETSILHNTAATAVGTQQNLINLKVEGEEASIESKCEKIVTTAKQKVQDKFKSSFCRSSKVLPMELPEKRNPEKDALLLLANGDGEMIGKINADLPTNLSNYKRYDVVKHSTYDDKKDINHIHDGSDLPPNQSDDYQSIAVKQISDHHVKLTNTVGSELSSSSPNPTKYHQRAIIEDAKLTVFGSASTNPSKDYQLATSEDANLTRSNNNVKVVNKVSNVSRSASTNPSKDYQLATSEDANPTRNDNNEKVVNKVSNVSRSASTNPSKDYQLATSEDANPTRNDNNEKVVNKVSNVSWSASTNPSKDCQRATSEDTKRTRSDHNEKVVNKVGNVSSSSANPYKDAKPTRSDDNEKMVNKVSNVSNSSTNHFEKTNRVKKDEVFDISLIPKSNIMLSDYNMILTENIELFKITSEKSENVHNKGFPITKVGLRCKLCSVQGRHGTAASFFPSSVNSIASGIGTIGARHFIGGKCPSLSIDTLERLKRCKKISQQQTRMQGRISLDLHCRSMAKREHLINLEMGGIQVRENTDKQKACAFTKKDVLTMEKSEKVKTRRMSKVSPSYGALVSDSNHQESTKLDRNDPSAFTAGSIEHFWECKHCIRLPYHLRASGSVVYSSIKPSLEQVRKHLLNCEGKKPLPISRYSKIETMNHEEKTSVVIKWDHLEKSTCVKTIPTRTKRRYLGAESAKKRKRLSTASKIKVNEDVEDGVLATAEDKALTTDFAHLTVMQLKKCYLTKSGGSRGNCPLGYPGLACIHCIGTASARRFFYTSADHLRNSFSHIPSHLAICTKCPESVKQKIAEFKATRSKQKAQLKNGDHKKFIDGLWKKLHGPDGGLFPPEQEEATCTEVEECDDGSTVSSLSDDDCHADFNRLKSRNSFWHDIDHIPVRPSSSELVSSGDRKEVTDYMYYVMLQMLPKQVEMVATQANPQSLEKRKISPDQKVNMLNTSSETKIHDVTVANIDVYKKDQCEDVSAPAMTKYQTIVCRYCEGEECGKGEKHILSTDELYSRFSQLPNQLFSCSKCPVDVKDKLRTFKGLRASQEAFLERGAQKKFMNTVWSRLKRYFHEPVAVMTSSSVPATKFSPAVDAINEAGLLTEEDRELVTQFTFFTMEQMKHCSLEKSGNGARSMFHYGFPGLSCIHCAGTPSARKFFYRTADILSGNYAHIPNHVASCKHCPSHIKRELAEKKKVHQEEKMRLHRGSQRVFFNNVWSRLHSRIQ